MKNSNISNLSDQICSKTFFPRLPNVTSNSLKHGRLHDFCGISPGGRREARPFWRNLSSGSRNFLSPSLIFHSHETGWKMTNGPDGPYCCLSLNQNLELPSAHWIFFILNVIIDTLSSDRGQKSLPNFAFDGGKHETVTPLCDHHPLDIQTNLYQDFIKTSLGDSINLKLLLLSFHFFLVDNII